MEQLQVQDGPVRQRLSAIEASASALIRFAACAAALCCAATAGAQDAATDAATDAVTVAEPQPEGPTFWDRVKEAELYGYFGAEFRFFFREATFPEQFDYFNVSLAWEPGVRMYLAERLSLEIVGFVRIDQHDGRRTHGDAREAFMEVLLDRWTIGFGLHKVFWGVTESRHLVDIINQTDLVEDIDGEEKLGQAMILTSFASDNAGIFDLYVMSWHRPVVFPAVDGRPRLPIDVANGQRMYESRLKQGQIDVALRWSHAVGGFDWALSYFYGTTREPQLLPTMTADGPLLVPLYELIHQPGFEFQWTIDAWLWKLESILRAGQGDVFGAVTGGVEYTFYGLGESDVDLGVLAEYNYDSRDNQTFVLLQNDAFAGMRLTFNDAASTDFLAGLIVDVETGDVLVQAEASRRFGESWKILLEGRAFFGRQDSPVTFFNRDHYLQLDVQYNY